MNERARLEGGEAKPVDGQQRPLILGPLMLWTRRTLSDPQIVILLLIVAAGVALLGLAGGVLSPILASIVIAWLFEGAVSFMDRRGLSRSVSATVFTAVFVAMLALALLVLTPLLLGQLAQLARQLPVMFNAVQSLLLTLPDEFPDLFDERQVADFASSLNSDVARLGQDMVLYSVSQLPTLATLAIYLFILPLLVFFFIKDRDSIVGWLVGFLPDERPLANEVWNEIIVKMGGYVRGRIYEMVIVGTVCFIAFWVMDLNFSALLAVLSGASVLIPYFGAPLVAIPVALTAFAQFGLGPEFVWVVALYTLIQTIDGTILGTLLLAGTVNLHPIAVMVAVLVFGDLYGFWGVFFAVPLASVAQVVLDAWRRRVRAER